jgi:GNAT superfamily N-acetyltransferase
MVQQFDIRPGIAADRDTIIEFNQRLASETEGKTLDATVLGAGVDGVFADSSRGRYFMACHDGVVVGQLLLTKEWSDWRNGDIWWIQSVYVRAEYRRRGVYRALHEYVFALAQGTPGVVGVRLYVEFENSIAQSTYRALGMEKASYYVMESMFSKKGDEGG